MISQETETPQQDVNCLAGDFTSYWFPVLPISQFTLHFQHQVKKKITATFFLFLFLTFMNVVDYKEPHQAKPVLISLTKDDDEQ